MEYRIDNLLNYCYRKTDSIQFQLFLITIKCLMPYEDNIGCLFDIDRYKKEIDLFGYYMNENNQLINYRIKHKKPLNTEDALLEFKIIPICLSNTIWDNMIEELIKAVMFYTLNKNTILDALLISSSIFDFMSTEKGKNIDIENIENSTRERLINFSIKEHFDRNEIRGDKDYIIDFEKERIKTIAKPILFEEELIGTYKVLNYIFKENSLSDSLPPYIEDKSKVLESFSAYLYRLRKGLIHPEKLKIPDKIPPIKDCLRHKLFNHPLLGRCKVLEKTENQAIVRTKSGLLRIRI